MSRSLLEYVLLFAISPVVATVGFGCLILTLVFIVGIYLISFPH